MPSHLQKASANVGKVVCNMKSSQIFFFFLKKKKKTTCYCENITEKTGENKESPFKFYRRYLHEESEPEEEQETLSEGQKII